jgi:hypothetical protein
MMMRYFKHQSTEVMIAELKFLLLEIVTTQETEIIRFIFNGQLLGNQATVNAARLSVEISDVMEQDDDELILSETTVPCYAEVFSVVLPNQNSKVCVRLPFLT